jgi:hypothetical protein
MQVARDHDVLPYLPWEITTQILDYYIRGRKELSILVRTCKLFYQMFMPKIYEGLALGKGRPAPCLPSLLNGPQRKYFSKANGYQWWPLKFEPWDTDDERTPACVPFVRDMCLSAPRTDGRYERKVECMEAVMRNVYNVEAVVLSIFER